MLAYATIDRYENGRPVEATITFDSATNWYPGYPLDGTSYRIRSVSAHELGHALGFLASNTRFWNHMVQTHSCLPSDPAFAPVYEYIDQFESPLSEYCFTRTGGGHTANDPDDLMFPSFGPGDDRPVSFDHATLLNDDVWDFDGASLTAPPDGATWAIGTPQTIAWQYESNTEFGIDVQIQRSPTSAWETVLHDIQGRTNTTWDVTGPPSDEVRLRVCSSSDPSLTSNLVAIQITELVTGDPIATLGGTAPFVDFDQHVAYSPDRSLLATRTGNGFRIYDASSLMTVATVGSGYTVSAGAFSPDGSKFAYTITSGETLFIYSTSNWSLLCSRDSENRDGESIVWIDNTRLALIGDTSGGQAGYRIYSSSCSPSTAVSSSALTSLASDGSYIYAGASAGSVYRWTSSGAGQVTFPSPCMSTVFSVALNSTRTRLAVVGRSSSSCSYSNVAVYAVPSGALLWSGNVGGGLTRVYGVSWNPLDPTEFAVATDGGERYVLSETGAIRRQFNTNQTYAVDVDWSPVGVVAFLVGSTEIYHGGDVTAPQVTCGSLDPDGTYTGRAVDFGGMKTVEVTTRDGVTLPRPIDRDGYFTVDLGEIGEGAHELDVCATDNSLNATCIECGPMTIPCAGLINVNPVAPGSGTACVTSPVELSWSTDRESAGFELEIAPIGASSGSIFSPLPSPAFLWSVALPDTEYKWRVRAQNYCGDWSAWTGWSSFRTAPDAGSPVVLVGPSDGSGVAAASVPLRWVADPQATEYVVRYGPTCIDAGTEVLVSTAVNPSYSVSIPAGITELRWAVASVDACGSRSDWSECWTVIAGEDATGIDAGDSPMAFTLGNPSPNPFNPSTRVQIAIPESGDVAVSIVDVRGRRVRSLLEGSRTVGRFELAWDGTDDEGAAVPSGLYFLVAQWKGAQQTVRLVLLK